MPLDVVRLRDSDLASTESPEACWAAVLLWAASWHQVPAASLPDDDRVLSNLAGYGRVVKEWMKIRDGAMRGWIKCSDGRLYHPVVAEKANESFLKKLKQRWATECARIKKHNDRAGTRVPTPYFDDWFDAGCPLGQKLNVPRDKLDCPDVVPSEKTSKGQGEGEGEGEVLKPEAKASSSPAKLPTCQTQSVIDLYHEILPNLPKVRLHTKDRVKAIRKVWDWVLTSLKPDHSRRAETSEQAIAWFRSYFERATDNDFLMGRTPRAGAHADWQCDIDFLLTDRGMKQVIEKTKESA